jgi:moderate conductance mechanosensitive channel
METLLAGIPERFWPYLRVGLRLGFIVITAVVVAYLLRRLVSRLRFHIVQMAEEIEGVPDPEVEKRAATVAGVFQTLVSAIIGTIAIAMSLREMGFDIGPLVAGAGVAGIAIGLGSQHLFKDLLNGFFLLIDDQVRVGDVAIVNGTGGVVEELNLRTTVLRDSEGVVHFFQNGNITSLANRTRDYSHYVFQIGLAYGSNVDAAIEILHHIDAQVRSGPMGEWIREPLEPWGIDQFVETGVILKARIKTQAGKQWQVGREMNRLIKAAFEEAGIEFQTRKGRSEATVAAAKDELRQMVREAATEILVTSPKGTAAKG